MVHRYNKEKGKRKKKLLRDTEVQGWTAGCRWFWSVLLGCWTHFGSRCANEKNSIKASFHPVSSVQMIFRFVGDSQQTVDR